MYYDDVKLYDRLMQIADYSYKNGIDIIISTPNNEDALEITEMIMENNNAEFYVESRHGYLIYMYHISEIEVVYEMPSIDYNYIKFIDISALNMFWRWVIYT